MKESLKSEISLVWLHAQLCQSLCNPMDHSPRGSSVHGNFQASIRDWVAISYSNCCLQIMVLEKTPESPLDIKEFKPVNINRNQP